MQALVHAGARPTPASWYGFARSRLLAVGATLMVAGAIFFVAANWDRLHPFVRMGLVATAMTAATLSGALLGLRSVAGRVGVLLGGALFGPLLAIYGQTYQTGADAWTLFAVWAFVFTGHALLARCAPGWLIWLLLCHLAAYLWAEQTLADPWRFGARALAVAGLAACDAAIVALAHRFLPAREGAYLARGAAALALVPLTMIVAEPIYEMEIAPGQGPSLLVLPAAWVGMAALYRRRMPDLFMLFLLATSVLVVASVLLGHLVFSILDLDDLGLWVLGIAICAEVWALARWLLYWRAIHSPLDPAEQPLATAEQGLEAPEAGDEAGDVPWFVHLFVALGTWVGAVIAGSVLVAVDVHEIAVLPWLLGAALLATANRTARREGMLMGQLTWVLAVSGQILVFATVAELFFSYRGDEKVLAICAVLLQATCVLAIEKRSIRMVCSAGLVWSLAWAAEEFHVPVGQALLIMVLTPITLALWVHEAGDALGHELRPRATWRGPMLQEPLAHGLLLGLVGPHVVLLTRPEPWPALAAVAVALAATGIWLVRVAARAGQGQARDRGLLIAACLALALVAGLTHRVPGVTMGMLLLVLAHLRRNRIVEAAAFIYLGGFLCFFYYQLSFPLLAKSVFVLATGAVLWAGVAILDRLVAAGMPRARARIRAWRGRDLALASALLAVCLALPAWAIQDKEQLLTDGRTVLLDLRPRDPRSLMQGDYMVLRYTLTDHVEIAIEAAGATPGPDIAVVALDDRGVARFVRLDRGEPLAREEQRLRFRHMPDDFPAVRIGAESYFFQEGMADRYATARYGQLAVDRDGNTVLVGLRDAELRLLGPARD